MNNRQKTVSVSRFTRPTFVTPVYIYIFRSQGKSLWENQNTRQIISNILQFAKNSTTNKNPLDRILNDHDAEDTFSKIPEELQRLIQSCLEPRISKRRNCKQLLCGELFTDYRGNGVGLKNGFYVFSPELRCKDLELPTSEEFCEDFLSERSIDEVLLS